MGTSNWQNIPFCVDALMKIAPQRVLDIGVGFGRWGMITREFGDVWYGHVLQPDWQIHLEGIEGFAGNITEYHCQFYNRIHIGDARQILPECLKSGWNLIIFGDVLEHFHKDEAQSLLRACLPAADYVLVNIPLGDDWPQEDMYDNPYERHLSVWRAEEFKAFHLKRQALFEDFLGRPFGSFVLSMADPKGVAESLFSQNSNLAAPPIGQSTPVEQQLFTQNALLRQELAQIKGSLTWQTYSAVDRSPLGKPLRHFMKVVGAPVRHRLAQRKNNVSAEPPELSLPVLAETHPAPAPQSPPASIIHPPFSAEEQAWLDSITPQRPPAIAILHPHWLGIRSSTSQLFPACYFVDDTLDEAAAAHVARLLTETGCTRFVFSGFPLSHQYLVAALRRVSPQIKLSVLWHGNFLQSFEDYAWEGFKVIEALCRQGLIYKWGFVKKGMAEVMARTGLNTGFVMNYVSHIPTATAEPLPGGPHLGIWGAEWNWRKLPYAMLAAAKLIPDAKIHGSMMGNRARDFGQLMGLDWGETAPDLIGQSEMSLMLAKMHLNLYVTLSECAPMLPLESLSAGAPCLLGPNSHLFTDNQFLHERLVVPYPDSAAVIAEYAQRVLAQRDEIIQAYIEYAPGYNERAKQSLREFLEL